MAIKESRADSYWEEHLKKFRTSGMSRKAYCQLHGLKIHQLGYRLDRWGGEQKNQRSAFARVIAVAPAAKEHTEPGRCAARLALNGGMALEFVFDSDPVWIARLILHLGDRR